MVGVSTACLYPLETEKSLELLVDKGVRLVEIFFNTYSEFNEPFIRNLKSVCDKNGVKVKSVHPFLSYAEPIMFFGNYERRKADGMAMYERYFEAAAMLGAEIFQFHGQKKEMYISAGEYAEVYSSLYNLAKKYNVIFSQENVSRCLCGDPGYVSELSDILGNDIRFTLDVKQANRWGCDPLRMAEAMKGKISVVHINDYNDSHDCLLPCRGSYNLKKFAEYLNFCGYHSDYIIEVYAQDYKNIDEIITSENNFRIITENIIKNK